MHVSWNSVPAKFLRRIIFLLFVKPPVPFTYRKPCRNETPNRQPCRKTRQNGAVTARRTVQVPNPTSCHVTTILTQPNITNLHLVTAPNGYKSGSVSAILDILHKIFLFARGCSSLNHVSVLTDNGRGSHSPPLISASPSKIQMAAVETRDRLPEVNELISRGQRGGLYRLCRTLGDGGYGTVFEAMEQHTRRYAATERLAEKKTVPGKWL